MKNFALIGAAGYIAVRHMKAIKDTGNMLIAALDKFDSVGIIDSYFPDADFFTEFERFDRHIDKLRHNKKSGIDFVSICTPNYLHDSHIRFALKQQADAVCEKPMVLNPWNVDALKELEKETGKKINNILQLRLHPNIIQLKQQVDKTPDDKRYSIDLNYITSRGRWYFISWKGEIQKSGGIATNIGVHFFDMLTWIFGEVEENIVHISENYRAAGLLRLKRADVRWFLSIDYNDIPELIKKEGKRTFRAITVNGENIDFSDGFMDLHTESYKEIINNRGFGLDDVKQTVQTVYEIRNANPIGLKGDYNPLLKK